MVTRLIFTMLLVLVITASPFAQGWIEVASMPGLGRHHPVNFSLSGYGYAVTGSTTGASITDDFYRYDPLGDSWEVLADFPGPDRSYSYGGAYNGKGYMGFGLGGGYLADLWEYDPVTGEWRPLASLPGSGRMHPAFVITDQGKIFVGMGGGPAGNLKDWWEYDIASNVWTRKVDLPGPARHHPYYFNIGKYPYVGFGHGNVALKDLYRFDPDTGGWTRMADFPGQGRVAGTQFSYGNRGYILDGEGEDGQELDTGEFWGYNPIGDAWSQLPLHPGSGRWAPGNFLINNNLYMMAGRSAVQMERDMWRFDMMTLADTGGATPENKLSLTLCPNPVAGQELRLLDLAPMDEVATIQLSGVDGRSMTDLASQSGTIQIPQDLVSGCYFLVFTMRNGTRHSRQITVLR